VGHAGQRIATLFGPGGIPTMLSIVILQVAHARGKTNLAGGEQSVAILVAATIVIASFASIVYLGTRLRPTQPIDVA